MNYKTEFSIQQLRTKSLNRVVSTLSVFVAAVIANMLVPQLLIKYVYDPTTLVEAPLVFELLPLVTYSIALLYFFYAMIVNFLSARKASSMEKELTLYSDCCSDGCCHDKDHNDENEEISDTELKELEKIVDEALKPKKTTSKRKTVASKKTVRRNLKK